MRDLAWDDRLADIGFSVGKGEIVGLGGLDGQGQRELLLALFGVLRGVSGTTAIDGRPRRVRSPADAKAPAIGMALIPEDRKTEGLMLEMSVRDNISLAALGAMTRGLVIDRAEEARRIDEVVAKLHIRADSLADPVATLSGGNQQKVVIAKWLLTGARIVLLNDPDARHRRRHQAGDVSPAARNRRRRRCDPVLFDRLRRTDRLLRSSADPV